MAIDSRFGDNLMTVLKTFVSITPPFLLAVALFMFVGQEASENAHERNRLQHETRGLAAERDAKAQQFINDMGKKYPGAQQYKWRTATPIAIKVGSHEPVVLSFTGFDASGQQCAVQAEAYADLAAKTIWMRPINLECGGNKRAVSGQIRSPAGRILDVVVTLDERFLQESTVTLTLPSQTAMSAWIVS